ncbi:hypothetical protein [Saccharothrix lopnurensis]|uniref:Ternary complex associated domain-containing protein n=1 Tax=Saccharothrix lopnurensis TaxID=1670621 RepID=A0ABW1NZF7_9PSEU
MPVPEIIFTDHPSDDRKRAEIRAALRRVPDLGPGAWPIPVDLVEVGRVLSGGASGALVVQVRLHRGDHDVVHVAKFDAPATLRREWHAYAELIAPLRSALFAPVLAASPEVVDLAADHGTPLGLVVYDHVGQYAGAPNADLRTLEDVARAAVGGGSALDEAVTLIDTLFTGMGQVLHRRSTVVPTPSSLRPLNPALGPNLEVRAHSTDPRPARDLLWPPDEVLRTSLTGDSGLRPGDAIALAGLRRRSSDDHRSLVGDDVLIRLAPGSVDVPDTPGTTVVGTVTAVRGPTHRDRLPRLSGTPVDPFTALPRVLLDAVPGRARAVSHGDLNPRNVVVVGGRPHLIDYARTAAHRPQQEDHCWLEIGLVRDVLAEAGEHDLLELHRVLALTSQALDRGVAPQVAAGTARAILAEHLHPAHDLLWAVRVQAHRHYPPRADEPWWQAYNHQLLLAAHRTFKWSPHPDTAAKLLASTVLSAVATEWITEPDPFRHWPRSLITRTAHRAADLMPVTSDRMVELFTRLTRSAHHTDPIVTGYRVVLVRERCAAVAAKLATDHDGYLDLTGVLDRITDAHDVELLGEPGTGKTATLRELARRTAASARDGGDRMPLLLDTEVDDPIAEVAALGFGTCAEQALELGAVRVLLDHPSGHRTAALRARYPRVPVTTLRRGTDVAAVTARLDELDAANVRAFLHARLTVLGHHSFRVDRLTEAVLDDPAWARVGGHRPALLTRLVHHVRDDLDRLPAPQEIALADLPHDDTTLLHCERLAVHLIEGTPRPTHPLPTDLLAGDRFRDPVHQDHFAARALLREPALTAHRLRHARWRSAGLFLVTLPEVDEHHVRTLVDQLAPHDPCYAAQLLATARCDTTHFATTWRNTLHDPERAVDWADAADALTEINAVAALRDTVTHASPDAALHALHALDRAHRLPQPRTAERAAGRELRTALLSALHSPSDTLRAEALDIVADTRLPGFELVIADLTHPEHLWLVTSRAQRALRSLGTHLPAEHLARHHHARYRRLTDIEARLPTTTITATAAELEGERAEHLRELAPGQPTDWLLDRRFAPGLDDLVATLLPPAEHRADPEDLLRQATSTQPPRANAAAHAILTTYPERARDLLDRVKHSPAEHHLLIAAAAVKTTRATDVAEELVHHLLRRPPRHRHALAALVRAAHSVDPHTGTRLAWATATTLADHDRPERLTWPWTTALAHCRGGPRELDALLLDPATTSHAVEALAAHDFHRAAGPRPDWTFSEPARRALLAHRTTTAADAARWVRAVATAGLTDALPDVLHVLTTHGTAIVARAGRTHPVQADALPAIGLLAKDTDQAHHVHLILSRSSSPHRLAGLAYLGDWPPVVTAALRDPAHLRTAHNALTRWTPGPHSPPTEPQDWAADLDTPLPRSLRPAFGLPTPPRPTRVGEWVTNATASR